MNNNIKIKNLKIKKKIILNYGSSCQCCGNNIWQFLTIDHINNNGRGEKQKIGSGVILYKDIIKNNYPQNDYQLLCFNCNSAKGHHGFCYHNLSNDSVCNVCNCELNNKNMFDVNIFYKMNICKICIATSSSKNKILKDNSIKSKAQSLNYKFDVIKNYGYVCACCGENNYQTLTIDHINNNGNLEKKDKKIFGTKFYSYLKSKNYPKDNYQLLCHNCNSCKGAYNICYHKLCNKLNKESIDIDEYINILYKG